MANYLSLFYSGVLVLFDRLKPAEKYDSIPNTIPHFGALIKNLNNTITELKPS